MSETKFTKGEWRARTEVFGGMKTGIIYIEGGGFDISGAPEMYDEIERDIENLRSLMCDMDRSTLEFAATIRKIDRKTKLLSKARGKK